LSTRSSLTTGGGKTAGNLEGIVNHPLEAGKGTDHENSCTKTLPETWEANVGIYFFDLLTSWLVRDSLIQNGDHCVSWMGDNSTENTSNISRHESDHKLLHPTVLGLGLSEDLAIEHLHDPFECNKLDDCVWNLPAPKRSKAFVEAIHAFGRLDHAEAFDGIVSECAWFGCLHSYFQGFPWAEQAISDDFCTGGGEGKT